jgi:hypothetical protein
MGRGLASPPTTPGHCWRRSRAGVPTSSLTKAGARVGSPELAGDAPCDFLPTVARRVGAKKLPERGQGTGDGKFFRESCEQPWKTLDFDCWRKGPHVAGAERSHSSRAYDTLDGSSSGDYARGGEIETTSVHASGQFCTSHESRSQTLRPRDSSQK